MYYSDILTQSTLKLDRANSLNAQSALVIAVDLYHIILNGLPLKLVTYFLEILQQR